tara:strand:- start:1971 stop:2225 length:255 start_codon:yes stop_codon:yes gene_type:complete
MPRKTARQPYQAKHKRKLTVTGKKQLEPKATKKQLREIIMTQRKLIAILEEKLMMKEKSDEDNKKEHVHREDENPGDGRNPETT